MQRWVTRRRFGNAGNNRRSVRGSLHVKIAFMLTLTPCRSCHRHCRISEKSCPFCGVRRVALGAGAIAIATLAIACDGQAAKTPDTNVTLPQPTTSASASASPTTVDAGAEDPDLYRAASMYGAPPVDTTPPPKPNRNAPMYGMPPQSTNH